MTQEDLYALLPFVLLALVFWFLVLRPARRRQREAAQTQSSVEVGARVMLTSGIFGEVVSVGEPDVEVQIAPGTVITVHRQAIGRVIAPESAAVEESPEVAAYESERTDAEPERDVNADAEAPELPTHEEK